MKVTEKDLIGEPKELVPTLEGVVMEVSDNNNVWYEAKVYCKVEEKYIAGVGFWRRCWCGGWLAGGFVGWNFARPVQH